MTNDDLAKLSKTQKAILLALAAGSAIRDGWMSPTAIARVAIPGGAGGAAAASLKVLVRRGLVEVKRGDSSRYVCYIYRLKPAVTPS